MSICRTQRCGVCTGCTSKACGTCTYCKDNPQFGGPGVKKQSCVTRRCIRVLESKLQREATSSRARAGCGFCADCRLPDCGVCVICLDQRFFAGHFLPGALCTKKKCANARPLNHPSTSSHLSSSSSSSQDAIVVVDGCCPKPNPSSVIEKQTCNDQIRLQQETCASRKRQSRSSALDSNATHLSYSKRRQSEQTIMNGNALGHDTTTHRHPLSAFMPPPHFAHHSPINPLTNSAGYVADGFHRDAATSMVNNFASDYHQPTRFFPKGATNSCASFYPYFSNAYRPSEPPAANGFCCAPTAAALPIPYFISAQPQQQQQQHGVQQQAVFMPKPSSEVGIGSGSSFASALSAFSDISSPIAHSTQVFPSSAVPSACNADAYCFGSMQNHHQSSHFGAYPSSDVPLKPYAEVPLPAYGSLARDPIWKQAFSTESFRRHPSFVGAFSAVGAGDYHHHSASMAAAGGYMRQPAVVDPVMQTADHQSVVLQQL
ncbi:CXXC zinc finger family protein [Trichuris trichiura]|uniref:CXXC zinc finger family protein n=1 Tax=Trichuris trichiura TaxID=36087 RepID=A0A077ZEW2_TRITR|nr:CXXC zinc finger family protein [Trichuris trichiura]